MNAPINWILLAIGWSFMIIALMIGDVHHMPAFLFWLLAVISWSISILYGILRWAWKYWPG
jgi:hypothetical protein